MTVISPKDEPAWKKQQRRATELWRDPAYREKLKASRAASRKRIQAGDGHIYVARVVGDEAIKIGFGLNVATRVVSAGVDFRVKLELLRSWPASLYDEHRLHAVLGRFRHPGYRSAEFYRPDVLAVLP